MTSFTPLLTAYAAALHAVAAVSSVVADYRELSENDFAELLALDAALLQQVTTRSALIAGETAHRFHFLGLEKLVVKLLALRLSLLELGDVAKFHD